MIEQALNMYQNRDEIVPELIRTYESWRSERAPIEKEWSDTQQMLFATDAAQSVGAVASSGWKNNSTRGKLTQIRDNLHANYASAILNNPTNFKWESYGSDANIHKKRRVITAYMANKLEQSNFDKTVTKLLWDYIDYGVAFASARWINKTREVYNKQTGITDTITEYTGIEALRHSPYDVVINPTAANIEDSPQFVRSLVTLGEILSMQKNMIHDDAFKDKIKAMIDIRKMGGAHADDTYKDLQYQVQGYGSYTNYLQSGVIELITYYGNLVTNDGELLENQRVVIADRSLILVHDTYDALPSRSFIKMAGWRDRPDNLYSQSPLSKLIGLQFRLDKLENMKADAIDLAIEPPIAIKGEVSDFTWQPGEVIDVDIDGDIQEMGKNLGGVITAQNEIAALEAAMEEFAGAPKQAMGFRTPGEKTAFEVQSLETAGSRIFQQKVIKFERELLEPLLNDMLALARINLQSQTEIKIIDPDLNVEDFISITVDDLIANGTIKAIGSRHYITKSQLMQELAGLFNSGMASIIQPHISGIKLAELIKDVLQLDKYDIVRPMVALEEKADMEMLGSQLQENVVTSQSENADATVQDVATVTGMPQQ